MKLDFPSITIFTPCYNSANTIGMVAECVNNQTFKSFEWIIYNDGSTDESDRAIREIIDKYPEIDIIYLNPGVNRGKHIAWNRAVEIARGELFICADADDPFESDSLEFLYEKWLDVKSDNRCCGVLGLVISMETGLPHAGKWPEEGWKSNYLEFVTKHHIKGETWGLTRTDVLKERKFWELYNGYLGEHYIWYGLALKGYYYCCYNHITRHYRTNSPDSIMASRKKRRLKPQQLQISILLTLWDLKYTSSWYLKYNKKEWFKMVAKLPYFICCYLFKSSKDNLF